MDTIETGIGSMLLYALIAIVLMVPITAVVMTPIKCIKGDKKLWPYIILNLYVLYDAYIFPISAVAIYALMTIHPNLYGFLDVLYTLIYKVMPIPNLVLLAIYYARNKIKHKDVAVTNVTKNNDKTE